MAATNGLSDSRPSSEPVDASPSTGSTLSPGLHVVAEGVKRRAAGSLQALLLSGSHATGEAVWTMVEGRRVCLSDLDLYAILKDEPACDAARSGDWTPVERDRMRTEGIDAPVEVAFLTRQGLSRLPARPGTLILRAGGQTIEGDPGVRDVIPNHSAADVDREERIALLENRGAELLGARAQAASGGESGRWFARHATLKAALDIAGVLALENGRWPTGAADRVREAEARLKLDRGAAGNEALGVDHEQLKRLWSEAVRWRSGGAHLPAVSVVEAEWCSVVQAWCWAWWRIASPVSASATEPWAAIAGLARRAPLPRRIRRAIEFRPRSGTGPSMRERLLHASRGTPTHRLMGSVTTLLFSAALSPASPALTSGALRLLDGLGVISAREWDAAAIEARRCWGRWVAGLDEERG